MSEPIRCIKQSKTKVPKGVTIVKNAVTGETIETPVRCIKATTESIKEIGLEVVEVS